MAPLSKNVPNLLAKQLFLPTLCSKPKDTGGTLGGSVCAGRGCLQEARLLSSSGQMKGEERYRSAKSAREEQSLGCVCSMWVWQPGEESGGGRGSPWPPGSSSTSLGGDVFRYQPGFSRRTANALLP